MCDTPETGSEAEKAMKRLSRVKLGFVWIRSPPQGSFSITLGSPPSTGSRYIVPVLSQKTRVFESGDQVIRRRKTWPPCVRTFGSPVPSAEASTTSYSPLASERYATHFPSGLHEPSRSAVPLVRVRLRGVPSLAGTDQMSPRALASRRLPLGPT